MEAYYVKERRHGHAKTSGFVPSVGLRGGRVVEDDSHSSSPQGDTPDDTSVIRATSLVTTLGGPSLGSEESWLPLYGYQGVVWFRTDMLYTFVDAVDRLLCLDNRAGVSYSLYLMDKRKKYATQAERDEFLGDLEGNGVTVWASGVGDYSDDLFALHWLLDRIGVTEEEQEASQKAIFVAGPADPIPWAWEPNASHRVQKVALSWPYARSFNRPDVAYLRMPENPADAIYTNQYGPWMANVCRVLAAGRIPGRPGYPAVPDAWFTLGRGLRNSEIGAYGGLVFPPQLWEAIVEKWENDQAAQVNLEAVTGPERDDGSSNCWHFFLPGTSSPYQTQYISPYEKQYIPHNEVGDVVVVRHRIMALVTRFMSAASIAAMQYLQVYLPGTGFFLDSANAPDVTIPMTGKTMDLAFQPVVDLMVKWMDRLKEKQGVAPVTDGLGLFPQFLSLRPVFKDYLILDEEQVAEPLPWDPRTTTVDQFRRLAGRVFSKAGQKELYSPDKSWIAIMHYPLGGPIEACDPSESKPRLLVGPKTTEVEWRSIRKMIVDHILYICLLDKKSLPRFGDLKSKQPFGFNDIYETPDALLYHQLHQGKIPVSKRHYDWQLNEKHVSNELGTVQPWEEQPIPLSTLYALTRFPLRPPPGTKLPVAVEGSREPKPNTLRSDDAHVRTPHDSMNSFGFRPVTDVEKGQRLRERSYAHPLDVRMHMSVPINAPPVDRLLDLKHDSVPVVSLSVLTPTEVRRLQRDYHNMRNLALSRIQRCPYPNCDAVYPANKAEKMEKHLQEKHLAEKCNFCDEQLFAHWTPEWRYHHMVERHSDVLGSYVHEREDDSVRIPDEGRTDRTREGSWIYCSRCGRHHIMLNVGADRQHHDNVCYPGVQEKESDWVACGTCGDRITDASVHDHDDSEDADAEKRFCEECALPLGPFSEIYRSKHLAFCKGHGRDDAQYCPWCGIQLDDDLEARMEHIGGCGNLPFLHAEGPIDMARRAYFPPGRGRVAATSGRAGEQATKRRRNEKAAEVASKAQKRPTKRLVPFAPYRSIADHGRMKITVPQPSTAGEASAEGSSPLSAPPSTSHSLPPPPPSAPAPATPAKAAGKTGAKAKPSPKAPKKTPAKVPAKAKPAPKAKTTPPKTTAATPEPKTTTARPTPKPAAAPKKAPPVTPPKPRKTSLTPSSTTTMRTRNQAKREAEAAAAVDTSPSSTDAEQQQQQQQYQEAEEVQEQQVTEKSVSAKVARTVSYAEPLERGASPVRGAGARRLGPAIHLAGVGTRWGY
ncbi:uncharacterized protein B0H64DRAFT_464638 [Chaetomium fimeti]|uniref:Uncharacterized protein n=1 Tax=Chaetomium fimeti TaxID=1854472 RepID=A0AAE0LPN2_9PEZI|nr:hypothetical protein B0H64DRAFT_464638 [Chaetomium fimeti]